ncbi:hypothetical protein F4811DRAFT_88569 [Daldinia bambusicola]|nr:hypothetical protein F4811DRAFT_88569 [Daldinia bambusicola]
MNFRSLGNCKPFSPFILSSSFIVADSICSAANKKLDGRFIGLKNNTLGIFNGDDVSPVKVYTVDSEKEGCNELHTYPVGIVDHSIGLLGPPDLLTLVDMMNPHSIKPGDGNIAQWDTFQLSDGKLTNDVEGQWLAFPSGRDAWQVKWTDGK